MQTQEYDVETINRLYAVNAELLDALEAVMGWYGLSDFAYAMTQRGESAEYGRTRNMAYAAIAKAKP